MTEKQIVSMDLGEITARRAIFIQGENLTPEQHIDTCNVQIHPLTLLSIEL